LSGWQFYTSAMTLLRSASSVASCSALLALSGCANFSDVADTGAGVYTLSATAVSYTMAMPALTAAAKEKATAWCASLDKSLQLRQQVRGWRPMQVELNFRCLAPDEVPASPVAFK